MRLYRELVSSQVRTAAIGAEQVDALAAILLHNSLFKFAIANYKSVNPELHKAPLKMETFPLAYLLFLCDELQCWDRTAYGRNTRLEMHPHSADMDFSSNALQITYNFDIDEQEKVYSYMNAYREWEASGKTEKPPRLKEYSDMAAKEQRFARDIELIVDTSNIPLKVSAGLKKPDRRSKRIIMAKRAGSLSSRSRKNLSHFHWNISFQISIRRKILRNSLTRWTVSIPTDRWILTCSPHSRLIRRKSSLRWSMSAGFGRKSPWAGIREMRIKRSRRKWSRLQLPVMSEIFARCCGNSSACMNWLFPVISPLKKPGGIILLCRKPNSRRISSPSTAC